MGMSCLHDINESIIYFERKNYFIFSRSLYLCIQKHIYSYSKQLEYIPKNINFKKKKTLNCLLSPIFLFFFIFGNKKKT